jgi:hypothetical protein
MAENKKAANETVDMAQEPIKGEVLDKDGKVIETHPEGKQEVATPERKPNIFVRGAKHVWGGVKAIGRGINGFRRKHPFWTGVIATTITGAAAYAGRVIYVKISGGDPEDVEIELPEDMPEEVAQTVTDAVQEIIQDDTLSDEEIQTAVMEAVQDAVSDLDLTQEATE